MADITDCTPVQIVWNVSQLLKEWKLVNILPHLQAEKVDAEILEMIKLHHIRMLLCNFPLGVQIRFEHNLELWRYNIGKPLHVHKCCPDGSDKQSYDKVLPRTHRENTTYIPSQSQSQKQPQINFIQLDNTTTNVPTPEESVETTIELVIPVSNTTPPETPTTNRSLASSSGSPARSTRSQTSDTSKDVPYTTKPQFSPKPYVALPKVNLLEILMKTKPEGPKFLKIYNVRKSFLRPERRRLLNAIVTYYLRNELRFDLQTSYALEEAILKMFPNERLEMYRKSRRGSLYCKYTNAKRMLLNAKQIDTLDSYLPDDDTIESSDMDTIAVTDDTGSVEDDCSDELKVENTAFKDENEDVNIDESEELSYRLEDDTNGNLIETKFEVDSEIAIQTAYRLHREVIVLTIPFSYQDFLSKAYNAYSISDMDDHYLAVNDCEISEMEFKSVLMQYYKLTTFVVEVKQKSSLLRQLNLNGNADDDVPPCEETTFEIDRNHLLEASEIRNIHSLLHVVGLSDSGKPLENRHRTAIAKAVIDECLSYNPDRTLKRQDFMILAQNICQAFPNEEESTYFIPSMPNIQARGKIWWAYNNQRSFLCSSGVVKRRAMKRRKTMDVGEFNRYNLELNATADEDDCADFSESTTMDWDYLVVKWSESHEQRRRELQKEKLTPSEYMDRYSILKSARGITLMEIDLHVLYPNALTVNNWLTLYGKVVQKAQGRMRRCEPLPKIMLAIQESDDERYSAGLALLLIPYILPHNGRKNELNGARASKSEIQQRFMKEYRSLDDLRADPKPADLQIRFVHSHRRVIYAEFGISGCIFQCSDLMEALGCLFHYIMAMNINYPSTCIHVWQFVQSAIFHIDVTKGKLPFVESTISDLNLS